MELGLTGKRALVTGASRGLGRAVALALAKEGCAVVAVARTEGDLVSLVEEMGGSSAGHSYRACDLTAPGEAARAADELLAGGAFDVAIHAAGGSGGERDPLSAWDAWTKALYFNAGIAIDINNRIVPAMRQKGWGRIVHISSISGEHLRGNALYAASKSFLTDYATVLGRALAPEGIVVSSVLPGAFKFAGSHWEHVEASNPALLSDFLRHHQAVGRIGSVEDIVPFVLFMASDLARFAPGGAIPVDGGSM